MLTCSDEEDASAQEDVVGLVVNASHPDAEPAQHQQAGAEDGEHAGGADDTCAEIVDSSEHPGEIDSVPTSENLIIFHGFPWLFCVFFYIPPCWICRLGGAEPPGPAHTPSHTYSSFLAIDSPSCTALKKNGAFLFLYPLLFLRLFFFYTVGFFVGLPAPGTDHGQSCTAW